MKKVRTLKILSWVLFGFGIFHITLLLSNLFEIWSIVGEWWAVWNGIRALPPYLLITASAFIGWYLLRRLGRKLGEA